MPDAADAQTGSAEASTYAAVRRDRYACSVYATQFLSSQFVSDAAFLLNRANRSTAVRTELQELGAGERFIRDLNLAANGMQELTARSLNLPSDFVGGSLKLAASQVSASTPILSPDNPAVWVGAARPTTEGVFHVVQMPPTPAAVPCGLAAAILQSSANGDSTLVEAFAGEHLGSEVFVPLVHHADGGFNTQVIVHNVGTTDTIATFTFAADSGEEETTMTIRSGSSAEVPIPDLPGAATLEIAGTSNARLMAAAYHSGPRGMAASNLGVSEGARRVALPMLFRSGGNESAYNSRVRVMATDGAIAPQITLRARETNEWFGPVVATQADGAPLVLLGGEAISWDLAKLDGLGDGVYSAEVDSATGSGTIAVVVEHVNARQGTLAAYTGIAIDADPPRVLSAPLVMKNREGANSGIQLQNLTGNQNVVSVTFYNVRGDNLETKTTIVQPRGSATIYMPDTSLPDEFIGTAEIAGSGAIAAVVNTVRYR
jgi:hypothetical protein